LFSQVKTDDDDVEEEINFGAMEPEPEPEIEPKTADTPEPPKEASEPVTPPPQPEVATEKAVPEPAKAKSYGASLFGIEDAEAVVVAASEDTAAASSSSEEEESTPAKVSMSTGEAIFADLPAVPDIGSTGATLFGMSDESAKVGRRKSRITGSDDF
jgi:type IV secretory pathway VirB10-like protein